MIPGSANPLLLKSAAAAAGGYQIERSLRFNSSDSAYLSRTPAVAGNRRTFTFSTWVKRSKLSSGFQQLICSYDGSTGSTYFSLIFTPSDTIRVEDISVNYRETTQVFRDASAWYCIQLAVDTTQATAANRIKLYVNGSEVTTFATTNNPTQNTDFGINNTVAHAIGRSGAQSAYYQDGYLAECYLIDGQQLTSSSFTEVSATTGQLIPKTYSGSYGTNGFQLKFADNSSNTAATLGKDTSGNSNNWTPNNLSVTAGAGNDSLVDTPTSYGTDTGVGNEVRGNYATLNPLKNQGNTLGNGNLDITATTTSATTIVLATIGISSGKWYWEYVQTSMTVISNGSMIGIAKDNVSLATYLGYDANGWGYYGDGTKYNNNSGTAYGASYSDNDVIGVAFDADAGTLVFYKNNTSQGTAFSGLTSGPYFPAFGDGASTTVMTANVNFGQRAFAYTAPSGFKALCDTNLPAPLTAKPNTLMDVVLYTGTGAALTPTSSLGFNPDWIWIKSRSAGTDNALYDVVRGAQARLESNTTDAEVTTDGGVTAFNSAGFTLGTLAQVNTSAATYVAWCWDAGTSTVSNTTGSITSQVRANATAGFSVITYTGTGANATVGHGLGVAPDMVIYRVRSGTSSGWIVYHRTIGGTGGIELQKTSGSFSDSSVFNNTNPTSTVLHVGTNFQTNGSHPLVAYAFAPVVGYSSVSSYVGNGSADGPFVYTGFRPRWIMFKKSSTTSYAQSWNIFDALRLGYNASNNTLYPNSASQEVANNALDILSNGFKIRVGDPYDNESGATYIYAAFAESPFQFSRAR